jgi:hypothetical protein
MPLEYVTTHQLVVRVDSLNTAVFDKRDFSDADWDELKIRYKGKIVSENKVKAVKRVR